MRLVLHDGALGDVIVALPAITAFARSGVGPVIGIGNPDHLAFATAPRGPLTAVRRSGEALQPLFADSPRLPETSEPITGLLAFAATGSRLRQNLLAACAAQTPGDAPLEPWLLPSPRELRGPEPASRQFVAALPPRLRNRAPSAPELLPTRDELARAAALVGSPPGSWWTAHIGAGAATKIPPPELLGAIIEAISDRLGCPPVEIQGPAELERRPADTPPGRITVRAPEPGSLIGLLAGSQLHLGLDSGPSHLAAALGRPGLVLFAPGAPRRWGPLGPRGATPRIVAPGADWTRLDLEQTARRAARIAARRSEDPAEPRS